MTGQAEVHTDDVIPLLPPTVRKFPLSEKQQSLNPGALQCSCTKNTRGSYQDRKKSHTSTSCMQNTPNESKAGLNCAYLPTV